jgi:hypothetical protein
MLHNFRTKSPVADNNGPSACRAIAFRLVRSPTLGVHHGDLLCVVGFTHHTQPIDLTVSPSANPGSDTFWTTISGHSSRKFRRPSCMGSVAIANLAHMGRISIDGLPPAE